MFSPAKLRLYFDINDSKTVKKSKSVVFSLIDKKV